jgi:hypothetical protein
MTNRGDRRNIDDRAAALAGHHRNHMLHGEVRAFEVDREHAVPICLRHLDDAADFGDADIVVEHIDAAIRLETGGHHGLNIAGPGRIGGKRACRAAFARNDPGGLFRGGGIAIDAEHLRALARKGHGGCFAIAPAGPDRAGPDHQRRLPLEPFHRLLPFMMKHRNPDKAQCNAGATKLQDFILQRSAPRDPGMQSGLSLGTGSLLSQRLPWLGKTAR